MTDMTQRIYSPSQRRLKNQMLGFLSPTPQMTKNSPYINRIGSDISLPRISQDQDSSMASINREVFKKWKLDETQTQFSISSAKKLTNNISQSYLADLGSPCMQSKVQSRIHLQLTNTPAQNIPQQLQFEQYINTPKTYPVKAEQKQYIYTKFPSERLIQESPYQGHQRHQTEPNTILQPRSKKFDIQQDRQLVNSRVRQRGQKISECPAEINIGVPKKKRVEFKDVVEVLNKEEQLEQQNVCRQISRQGAGSLLYRKQLRERQQGILQQLQKELGISDLGSDIRKYLILPPKNLK